MEKAPDKEQNQVPNLCLAPFLRTPCPISGCKVTTISLNMQTPQLFFKKFCLIKPS